MLSQNAANAISEIKILKIFRGSMPMWAPLGRPGHSHPPILRQVSATGW